MNEIVREKAVELARLIAQSKEYISMRLAEDAAMQDPEITALTAQYYEKQAAMEVVTSANEPDYKLMAEISKEMSDLQQKMKATPVAQTMQNARRSFTEMMNMVNQELENVLSPGENHSCSGDCTSCHGCH